jgi:hypothetical protein
VAEVLDAGARIGVIAGTCSTPEERMVDAALATLGPEAARRLRVYMLAEDRNGGPVDADNDDDDDGAAGGSGRGLSLEQQFAKVQAKVRAVPAVEIMLFKQFQIDSDEGRPGGLQPRTKSQSLAKKR